MGLKIELRENMYCEVLVCDWCQKVIRSHRKSMLLWYPKYGEKGAIMDCYSLCRGECLRRFEEKNGRASICDTHTSIAHLVRNLEIDGETLASV